MANELVDVVTATPTGPVSIGIGQDLNITGRFTLNGPSGAIVISRTMAWNIKDPLGIDHSVISVDPVVELTDYLETMAGSNFFMKGIYHLTVSVATTVDTPDLFITDSNVILVDVKPFKEEEPVDPSPFAEEVPAAGSFAEETAASNPFVEESPAAQVGTEETGASTSWTEESQA